MIQLVVGSNPTSNPYIYIKIKQKNNVNTYPLILFLPTQLRTRGFELGTFHSGLKSKLKKASKANIPTFLTIRWHVRSLNQIPFYFNRLFGDNLELPKKLFTEIQIKQFS